MRMADGSTFKRCSCKDSGGKPLGQKCPKLRRVGGAWSHRHGSWNYQLELPPTKEGKRRGPLRRGGFDSQDAAEAELAQVRQLLALADPLEPKSGVQIADLIKKMLAETGVLPGAELIRRKVRTGQDLSVEIMVGEWLEEFLKRKRTIEETTRRSYEGHIRLYLMPYLGHLRLGRLKVSDIADMFDEITEFNAVIVEWRASDDPQVRASVKYRRPIGVSTMHSIRATLRHALNLAISQDRLIDFNPAAVKALGVLTGEVGVGKTVAVRSAIAALDPTKHTIIYIANPAVGTRGICHHIVVSLGGKPHLHRAILIPQTAEALATEAAERARTPVVVIDEAHLLEHDQLESIRMLTNHDLDSRSPAAILLVGQPTLRRQIKLGVLTALDQRISVRWHMTGLTEPETAAYIHHHLRHAGREDPLFSEDAITLIHETSRGKPRTINNLAKAALIATFAQGKKIVDESAARAAVSEVIATE
jgi:type II secretory pathway predicted ATPase ExeA